MTMRFPYRLLQARQPVVSLSGRLQRPRSLISVSLIGPVNTVARDGLLDTGALFRGSREEVELTVNDLYPGT
jgi:hypothetical protein